MKRRLLSAFLAVMMVLTMAPVAFAADTEPTTEPTTEYVAQVDGNNYATIADAIAAANNKTLTLLKDVNGQIVIPEGKKITLDLNGHAISNSRTAVLNNGNLTICDSSEKKSGVIKSTGNVGIGVGDNSYTTIEYANIQSQEGAVITSYSTGATIIIKDGVFSAADNSVVAGNGSKRDGNANVITINGGTFIGNIQSSGFIACGIYAPWKDIITVNGGNFTVNNGIGIVARAGQVTVNGGTFTCTGSAKGGVGDKKFDMDAAQCVYFDASNPAYPAYNSETDYIKLQGGKFSSDVSAYVAKGYVQNENGTVEQLGETNAVAKVGNTYYKTLSAAVAVAKDGDTVTLLKNTVEDVVIPADKTITLDLNGKKIVNSTTAQDSKVADDARKHTITNNGTLTIMDSVGGGVVDNVSHGRAALYNNGTITEIKGGKFTRSVDNSTDSESANGNSWYVVYNAEGATISKISNGEFLALGHFSSLFSNCGTIDEISGGTFTQDHFIAFKNEGTVNKISGGVFSSADESCIQNWGTIGEICGGTITAGGLGVWNFSSDHWTSVGKVEKISGGEISGTTAALRVYNYDVMYEGAVADSQTNKAFIKVTGGKINGALEVSKAAGLSISGGYFTTDPSKYLATYTDAQKKYIAKAVTGDYKFHVELADANDLQVVPVAGATAAPSKDELKNNKDIPSDQVDNIVTAAKAVSAPEISKAAQEVAANISDNSNTLGKQYQDAAKDKVPNQEKIEVRTYLDVEPKAYNKSAYTLDITPKYDVVVVGTKDGATAEKVVASDTLKVTNATNVSIQLPADFVENTDTLYVQHKGHEYDAAVTANNGVYTANFTNPDGFSEFTISKTSQSVAKVGNNKYTTLQNAIDAAQTGATIVLQKDCTEKVTVAGKSLTINRNGKTFGEANVTVGSNCTKEVKNDTIVVTYTKPSSGSSSGGSSSGKTTYKVTTSAVNNGGVNASPSNAEKGAVITITLSPDKGYKLDKLTVTDGSGKTVSTVKKSDTVYTFTMPASAVKVGVSYVKATETPSETKFNDVSANDWFASAVDYVTGKGMMNGTADNTFSPKANTTRGMVVTVLYRLENQPSTSAASFTDVASGAYYANAVAWANANGIVSGYGSGKFGPNDKVTREQLAAILYRYAQYKKYDVSVGEDTNILSYDDAQSISTYAIPAIQWACGAGVVTGKSGSKLDPKGNATRAEVAAMLMRFCENVK